MAKAPSSPKESKDNVLLTMGEDVPKDAKEDTQTPAFKMVAASKILVSKSFGKNVERRKQAAIKANEVVLRAWNEAYRYYNHNQVKEDLVRRGSSTPRLFRHGKGYENIVYANTSTMIPAIYAKNPDVAFSTDQDEDKDFVLTLSKAVNAIFNKKQAPGINLKPRMKKASLHAELTNFGVLKLDFVQKEDSRETAQAEMEALYQEMQEAKDIKEVKAIEGKMMALETNMEWMVPSGFTLAALLPTNVIVDPTAENEDGSDCNWILEETYIATDYLNARFAEKDEDGNFKSIYKPTHKIKADGAGSREDSLGLVLEAIEGGVQNTKDNTDEDRQSYIYQNMTKSFYYWDKVTRRIYLFVDNDWTWPIWAWEDLNKTSRFFPYYFIQWNPSTGGITSPGEVSFYLDQQDEINTINEEIVRIRRMVFKVLVYNMNKVKPDEAKKLANYLKTGEGDNILGIDVPEGMALKDAMEALAPPSINYEQLFDKTNLYKAVDRLSSVSDALRGTQFKPNTTQDAVDAYTSAVKIRIGNKTDAIEECVGEIAWSIAEILVSTYSKEQIIGLIGEKHVSDWKNMSVEDFNSSVNVQVAAGSTEKPTSAQKRKESIQIVQAIGQFAKAAPGASLKIILKLLMVSFPELDVTEEDWAGIEQEVMSMMQKGTTVPGEAPPAGSGAGTPPGQGQPPGAAPPAQGGAQPGNIQQMLENVPTAVKAEVLKAIKSGVSPQQALAPVLRRAK